MRATYYRQAFAITLPDAEEREPWYVCLMIEQPFYGGPEEGGWWGEDTVCVAAKECHSRSQAEKYAGKVQALAEKLSAEARDRFGRQCLREIEQLEARGLDADSGPEPDGEERYFVCVCRGIPEPSYGSRRYE